MQGGYSDDLTVASKCAEHKLQILCPSYAVLPQWYSLTCLAPLFDREHHQLAALFCQSCLVGWQHGAFWCWNGPIFKTFDTCRLDAACTAKQCWNYLRRQLYVMDTYCNAHNRTLNHTMLALHSYLSWAFILPLFLTGLDLAAALPAWSSEVCLSF